MKKALKDIARGDIFPYAGQKWVVLNHYPAGTLCITENCVEHKAFDDNNHNNFAKSSSNRYLNGPFFDNLIDACGGSGAFRETALDLTADDGLKDYGTCHTTIFLLTESLYQENRSVIPVTDDCWWLSTAVSTEKNGYPSLARFVGSDGALSWDGACYGRVGLRPACYLDPGLVVSIDEDDITAERAGELIKNLIHQMSGSYATEDQFTAAATIMLDTLRNTKKHSQEASDE